MTILPSRALLIGKRQRLNLEILNSQKQSIAQLHGRYTIMKYMFCLIILLAKNGVVFAGVDLSVDKTLLYYQSRAITCATLTGISYSDGLAAVKRAEQQFEHDPYSVLHGRDFPPALWPMPFQKGTQPDLVQYYNHLLESVIELFIVDTVRHELITSHPSLGTQYYDAAKVDDVIRLMAMENEQYILAEQSAILYATDTAITFRSRMLRDNDFVDWSEDEWEMQLKNMRAYAPYRLIVNTCFPTYSNGKVVPWYEMYYHNVLSRYDILEELYAHGAEYVDAYTRERAPVVYLHITGVTPSNIPALDRLLKELVAETGEIALNGLNKTSSILHELQSGSTFRVENGTYRTISEMYGIAMEGITAKMILSTSSVGEYIYIAQNPLAATTTIRDTPRNPTAMYFFCKQRVLRPIVEKVINKINVENDFKIRSVDDIIGTVGGYYFPQELFGKKIDNGISEQ